MSAQSSAPLPTPAGDIVFSDDPEKAGVNNLLGIYKVITDKSQDDVVSDFADARGYGDLKSRVAEVVIDALAPISAAVLRIHGTILPNSTACSLAARRAPPPLRRPRWTN